MYKAILLSLIFTSLSFFSSGQQKIDKDSILLSEVSFKKPFDENLPKIKNTLYHFINDDIDSNDVELISNDIFIAIRMLNILVKREMKPGKITYRDLLDDLKEFKEEKDYAELKAFFIAKKFQNQRPWLIANWQQDSSYLSKNLNYPQDLINGTYTFLKKTSGQYKNYEEAITAYAKISNNEREVQLYKNNTGFYDNTNVGYLKYTLLAKEQNKPILLCFVGHSCVNCKKMESNIFSNEKVYQKIMDDFIMVSLYVDDKTPITESSIQVFKNNGEQIKTVGAYNLDIQETEFNSNAQPTFVVIDYKGNILGKTLYTNSVEDFMDFLEKVLKK